ncbi:hypothetical protein [Bacillus sp. Marseille-P3661]|nr:hypothetical protein [Bacillus sp. Marseille-P3661]
MEMYQQAYNNYLKNCERYEIDRVIDFKQFLEQLTSEQIEKLSQVS